MLTMHVGESSPPHSRLWRQGLQETLAFHKALKSKQNKQKNTQRACNFAGNYKNKAKQTNKKKQHSVSLRPKFKTEI